MRLAPAGLGTKGWILLASGALVLLAFAAPIQWPSKARHAGYVFVVALGGIGLLVGDKLAEEVNRARGLGDPDDD